MGIITTIKNLFSRKENINDDDFQEEKEEEIDLILSIYEQTRDNEKYNTKSMLLKKELEEVNLVYQSQENYKIQFHFIPHQQNFKNVRSYIEFTFQHWQKWQDLRLLIFSKTGNKCQCCSKLFSDKNIGELHEYWIFDEINKIQKLDKLIPLCNDCHSIAHISRYKSDIVKSEKLLSLYTKHNKLEDEDKVYDDLEFANKERNRRTNSKVNYLLDLYLLNKYGFQIDEYFDCHSNEFNLFIEDFKKSKSTDE